MSEEKPTVRIFLSDIFQEFPPAQVRPGIGRRSGGPIARDDPWHNEWSGDWRTNWPNDWAGNWTNNSSDVRFTGTPDPTNLRELLLRHEQFGGIAYSPSSKRVYSFNAAGFELLKKLQAGALPPALTTESMTDQDVKDFLSELNRLGIVGS